MIKASDLYEQEAKYCNSIQVLVDAKLFVEAATKAKKLETSGFILSEELSSAAIAREQLLKLCNSPSDSETVRQAFHDLLPFTREIAFIKHAKRFDEAFDYYYSRKEYSELYRLALAQDPYKKTSGTVFEHARRLSSRHGHEFMQKILVIHSARAFLHPEKFYPIFLETELEKLTSDCDHVIRLNALLLLAKYAKRKLEKAVEACCQQDYIPGEIELAAIVFSEMEDRSIYSRHYQIELIYKIHFLLALEQERL